MKFKNVIQLLIDSFQTHQMDHALIGGFALKAYGYMRTTQDADFIVRRKNQWEDFHTIVKGKQPHEND